MIGAERLHQHAAALFAAPGAARDLRDELKRPLRARKSGRCKAVSALITPTSVTFGKSSPLAIICVPSKISNSPR